VEEDRKHVFESGLRFLENPFPIHLVSAVHILLSAIQSGLDRIFPD
jgi:hypothetical protein